MRRRDTATLVLTSYAMGDDATLADYEGWEGFVASRIDERVGFEVEVGAARFGCGPAEDHIVALDDDKQAVRDALAVLWEEFCAEGTGS